MLNTTPTSHHAAVIGRNGTPYWVQFWLIWPTVTPVSSRHGPELTGFKCVKCKQNTWTFDIAELNQSRSHSQANSETSLESLSASSSSAPQPSGGTSSTCCFCCMMFWLFPPPMKKDDTFHIFLYSPKSMFGNIFTRFIILTSIQTNNFHHWHQVHTHPVSRVMTKWHDQNLLWACCEDFSKTFIFISSINNHLTHARRAHLCPFSLSV